MLEPDIDVLFNMWFKQPIVATSNKGLQHFKDWFDNRHISMQDCIRRLRRTIVMSSLFGIETDVSVSTPYTFNGLFTVKPNLLPVVDTTILKLLTITPVVAISEKRWFAVLPDWDRDYLIASCRIDFQEGGQQ